jgi:hypothetical protein
MQAKQDVDPQPAAWPMALQHLEASLKLQASVNILTLPELAMQGIDPDVQVFLTTDQGRAVTGLSAADGAIVSEMLASSQETSRVERSAPAENPDDLQSSSSSSRTTTTSSRVSSSSSSSFEVPLNESLALGRMLISAFCIGAGGVGDVSTCQHAEWAPLGGQQQSVSMAHSLGPLAPAPALTWPCVAAIISGRVLTATFCAGSGAVGDAGSHRCAEWLPVASWLLEGAQGMLPAGAASGLLSAAPAHVGAMTPRAQAANAPAAPRQRAASAQESRNGDTASATHSSGIGNAEQELRQTGAEGVDSAEPSNSRATSATAHDAEAVALPPAPLQPGACQASAAEAAQNQGTGSGAGPRQESSAESYDDTGLQGSSTSGDESEGDGLGSAFVHRYGQWPVVYAAWALSELGTQTAEAEECKRVCATLFCRIAPAQVDPRVRFMACLKHAVAATWLRYERQGLRPHACDCL